MDAGQRITSPGPFPLGGGTHRAKFCPSPARRCASEPRVKAGTAQTPPRSWQREPGQPAKPWQKEAYAAAEPVCGVGNLAPRRGKRRNKKQLRCKAAVGKHSEGEGSEEPLLKPEGTRETRMVLAWSPTPRFPRVFHGRTWLPLSQVTTWDPSTHQPLASKFLCDAGG